MEIKTDTSRVLMSDVLKGKIPELDGEVSSIDEMSGTHLLVLAERTVGAKTDVLAGILRSMLFDAEPEVAFRLEIADALDLIEASGLTFDKFELHHGTRVVNYPGPFVVFRARIEDISAQDQLCTVSLHLKRAAR